MQRRRGFTLVEVMIALGVMTIGAMSIIAMQQQTTRANVHARDMTIATQIAQTQLERLKLDALVWNAATSAPQTDLTTTFWLGKIVGSTPGSFMTIAPRPDTNGAQTRLLTNAFSYYGVDMDLNGASAATLAQVRFCASHRLSWIYNNFRVMRADVRVWWTKEAPTHSITSDFPGCADDNASLNPNGAHYDDYHVVYLSTVLRPTAN
jgi:type II secretion system protein I